MKRFTAMLLIVLSLMMLLTSCGSTPANSGDGGNSGSGTASTTGNTRPTTNSKAENSLVYPIGSIPTTLDPEHFALQTEDMIINQVYETLWRQKLNGEIVNFLAEEWTLNEDGSVSITLRDAKFHSGDTLKSEDVEYTVGRLATSTLSADIYGYFSVEVEDDTHLKLLFPYAEQGAGFNELLPYLVNVRIENKSWAETQIADVNDTLPLAEDGTGAYVFSNLSDGGDVTLTRFEDYWGDATLDSVKLKYLTGSADIAFESGDIDMASYVASAVGQVKDLENVTVEEVSSTSVTFLILGCNENLVTSDLKVRQAIAYALNREDLASAASDGSGKVAYNIAPPTVEYYTEDVEKFERNVEKSKELMAEAGYSDSNRAHITLITLGAQTMWVSACELAKANLEESYFTVDIEQQDSSARYFQGDYEMGIINFSYTTSFPMYNVLFNLESGIDLAWYDGSGNILDTFSAITDEATAQKAMREAVETIAYYPLFYPTVFYAKDSDLDLGPDFGEMETFFKDLSWKD